MLFESSIIKFVIYLFQIERVKFNAKGEYLSPFFCQYNLLNIKLNPLQLNTSPHYQPNQLYSHTPKYAVFQLAWLVEDALLFEALDRHSQLQLIWPHPSGKPRISCCEHSLHVPGSLCVRSAGLLLCNLRGQRLL